jgi:hypothetical protein
MQGLIYSENVTAFWGGLAVLERTQLGQNTEHVLSRVLILPYAYAPMRRAILLEIDRLRERSEPETSKLGKCWSSRAFITRQNITVAYYPHV